MLGNGDTVGVFQLESAGMRDVFENATGLFEDIIALVALSSRADGKYSALYRL